MKQSEIKQTIKEGQIIQTPHIRFHRYIPLSHTSRHTKPVVIVSKKINSSSVVRHKYQRWMRELLKSFSSLPVGRYVLVAKPSICGVTSLHQLISSIGPQARQDLNKK